MSALAYLASPKTEKEPVAVPIGTLRLRLPAGTDFSVHVEHLDPNAERIEHSLTLECSTGHQWIDTESVLHVTSPLPPFSSPTAEPDDNTLAARSKRFARISFRESSQPLNGPTSSQIWNWLNVFFALWPMQEYVVVLTKGIEPLVYAYLILNQLAILPSTPSQSSAPELLVSRAAFWQGFGSPTLPFAPWILPSASAETVAALASSNTRTVSSPLAPPFKPSSTSGPLYTRYFPDLSSDLTFRVASSSNPQDVDLITQWHATDRVNNGWRQRLSRDEQVKTIEATEKNPYTIGLIGWWGDEPWGYVELYYAKQSNLKDFYNAGQFDRGFHALVGEEKFRGPHRVRSWMGAVVHLMFLLDPSTTLCVSEPRLSNSKMVAYEEMVGGHVEKIIDFDHKRAALVFFNKERFFQLCPIGVLPEHKHLCKR